MEVFSVFEKNGKKFNHSVSRTTLCISKIEKYLFEYKVQFAVEKKSNFKIFCRHQKNANHTISIYDNCKTSVFLIKVFLFYLARYTEFYAKTRKKFFEISMTHFTK